MADIPKPKRILVGAGSFTDAVTAIRLAGQLADDIDAFLGGMMIEQEAVLEACRLPNQRVISGSGSVFVAPSTEQVRTLIEADAKAFRQMLADIAGADQARWTFEQRVGDMVRTMSTAAKAWDILVFGHRNIHRIAGQIVLFEPDLGHNGDAARIADLMHRRLPGDVIVFRVGNHRTATVPGHRRWFDTVDDALAQLARTNAQAVIVDLAGGPIRTYGQLRTLLEVARCPVIVLGAAMAVPRMAHDMHTPAPPGDTQRQG